MAKRSAVQRAAFVLLLASISVALISCGPASTTQTSQPAGAPLENMAGPGDDGAMFPGLEGIPRDQLFDHFLGGQFNLTDKNGTPFTLTMTPGTVDSVSTTSVSIVPNGQTVTQTFNVTTDTIVRAAPGRGSIQAVAKGDKVVIITRDTSTDAVLIAKHGPTFHRRMMESIMGD